MPVPSFRQRATKGFAWNHLYKLVEYGLLNLYTILVVRHFGPELAAPYAVYLSIGSTLAIIGAFSVDGVLLRFIPRLQSPNLEQDALLRGGIRPFLHRLLAFRLLIILILVALVAITFLGLPQFFPELAGPFGSLPSMTPYLALYLLSQSVVMFCTFSLMGLLQLRWVFFASLASRILLITAGILLLQTNGLTLESAVIVHSTSAAVAALLLSFWLWKEVSTHANSNHANSLSTAVMEVRGIMRYFAEFIRRPRVVRSFLATPVMLYGIATWGNDILSTVLGRAPDILMMRVMLGERSAEIGYYQVASLVVLMSEYIFLFGLGGALVSVFSSVAHSDEQAGGGYQRLSNIRKEVAGFQTLVTLPLFLFMLIFAEPVIGIIFKSAFLPSTAMVRVGVLITILTVVLVGGGMQITSLVAIGKERLVFKNRLTWGVINIVGNFFLIRRFGALGAIAGTYSANLFACSVEAYFARKYIGSGLDYSASALIAAIALPVSAVGYWIGYAFDNPTAQVGAGGVVIFGLSGLLYYLFKVPQAAKLFSRLSGLRARTNP